MAAADSAVLTESDDAEDSADDSTARKLLPSGGPAGSCDSGINEDAQSGLGKRPHRRKRIEWETVESWDLEHMDEDHVQDCIRNNAQQFMRAAGLSFVAGLKKKATSLDCWVRRSKKMDKDGSTTVNIFLF
jgi:hypothetical protein